MSVTVLCPSCGADEWRACYSVDANQDVRLTLGSGGGLEPEYDGNESIGDPSSDNEYWCDECETTFTLEALGAFAELIEDAGGDRPDAHPTYGAGL